MRNSRQSRIANLLIVIGIAIILIGSFVFGAMSTTQQPKQNVESSKTPDQPAPISLEQQLTTELPQITETLLSAYPKISTDYTIENASLYDKGQWFGAVLRYKGADNTNRDSLRVLLQKEKNTWKLRTTPPRILLSSKEYPDVPKDILIDINKVVGLP